MIRTIKEIIKTPFKHWVFNPFAIAEIINQRKVKKIKNATTKLDIYKQFYK